MKLDSKKLQIAMARKEVGVRDLAKMTGLSFGTVSKYVNAVRNPTLKPLGKIANSLGVDVTELIMDGIGN